MERSYAFYVGGLGVIMLLSLLLNNVPLFSLSLYWKVPFKKEIAAACFLLGSIFGAYALYMHVERAKTPWAIPQSKVSIPYILFLVMAAAALIVSH